MMKLFIAASTALLLGLTAASAAPIRAPALGQAIDSPTTQAMMEHRTMHRGMMHRRMMHRPMMHHRGMMMRHRTMHRRMMHHM